MPPFGAAFPSLLEQLFGGLIGPDADCGRPAASRIDCLNQALRTSIEVAGSDQALHYSSLRVPGGPGAIQFPVTGESLPEPLERVEAEIHVAGHRITRTYENPVPNMRDAFEWDGVDVFGRPLQGNQPVTVRISYVYQGEYGAPFDDEVAANFGRFPENITGNRTRQELTFWQEWTQSIEGYVRSPTNPTTMSVGGWSLTDHHRYDPNSRTLYLGDGSQRTADTFARTITTVAGTGERDFGGDGGPATEAHFREPAGIDVGPDGSLYIADNFNHRIRRVDPDGFITTVAGSGDTWGFSGDGGPATEAQLADPEDVAVTDEGVLYIADMGNGRIRRVGTDGIITTIAGSGDTFGFSGDGGPATEATLNAPDGVAVGPDGSVYIADTFNHRIRRVAPDGIITTVAGSGETGFAGGGLSGDGGRATEAVLARPTGVAVTPDGGLLIADFGNHRVRRVGPDGIITTVAGTGEFRVRGGGFSGDGGPATQADLDGPLRVTVAPNGGFYIADSGNHRVRFVGPDGTITTAAGSGPSR